MNECQKSPAAHSKSAKLLWELALQDPEGCLEEICTCLKHVLLIEEVTRPSSYYSYWQGSARAVRRAIGELVVLS